MTNRVHRPARAAAVALLSAGLAAALAGVPGPGAQEATRPTRALCVPEQILPRPRPATGATAAGPEQIAPSGGARATGVAAEQIAPAGASGPQASQVDGRGDLLDFCDPSVPEAERRRLGIDCEALERARAEAREAAGDARPPRTGSAADPLLTPRDDAQRQQFRDLGLGDDVPATVILQQ